MSSLLRPRGSTRAWRRLRAVVLARDGYRCQFAGQLPTLPGSWAATSAPAGWPRDELGAPLVCGAFAEHADHVTPRAAGGTDQLEQLRAACARHNLERGARPDPTTRDTERPTAGRWEW